jgi:hypothetical protein
MKVSFFSIIKRFFLSWKGFSAHIISESAARIKTDENQKKKNNFWQEKRAFAPNLFRKRNFFHSPRKGEDALCLITRSPPCALRS